MTERERRPQEQRERFEEFASNVAHDLRNPLTGAFTFLEVARETGDDDAFEEVQRSLDRMERIIDDLLWLAREGDAVEATQLVHLDDVLEEARSHVDTQSATLEVEAVDPVEGDRDLLVQLFENLLRNAVEHGGPDVRIEVGPTADGFYVEDDGPGIPEADREHVFESGYTTASGGTGYGLAIVDQIARAHGWRVELAEDAGGARFEVHVE